MASFQSPIPGVPERQYSPQFYQDVEAVFSSLLPMFQKLGVLDGQGEDCYQDLQVITKVQEYVLPKKSQYSGRWHTEGFTERIVAAGVYYLDTVQAGYGGGGDLLFRPPTTPGKGYCKCVDGYTRRGGPKFSAETPFGSKEGTEFTSERDVHPDDKEEQVAESTVASHVADCIEPSDSKALLKRKIETALLRLKTKQLTEKNVKRRISNHHLENLCSFRRYTKKLEVSSGTAVAFSNDIPHRFDTIHGSDWIQQRRLFINFFIVDPKAGLKTTTANSASFADISRVMHIKGIEDANLRKMVGEFCGGYSNGDWVHRKVMRDQARAAMSAGRQHWKTQYFGNAGYLQFFRDARWNSNQESHIGVQGRNYEHSVPSSGLGSGM